MPTSAKEFIRILERNGFRIVNQNGSHIKLKRNNQMVIIPKHSGDLKKGLEMDIRKRFNIYEK